jgi:sulfate adenylyltransferase subunit 1
MTDLNQAHLGAMELLRFSTAGSVDDGKSTLIGRLLYDSKSIFEDTLQSIERSTQKRGGAGVDLALLTDGLQAEREQGITIDVAYRYFATPHRKFIIADTPGHEQYTRNMVTGASTADLAIVLVDARKGPQVQSHRHAYLASLLGIPNLVVAVNKMDLVDYRQEVFAQIRADFLPFCEKLNVPNIQFIPLSALQGDMVVERLDNLSWYQGPTLLEALEAAPLAQEEASGQFRFPVQLVSRPQTPELHDFRGYMGRIVSGDIRAGDAVTVLPSGQQTTLQAILFYEERLQTAQAPQSVVLMVADPLDISRGDMLVRRDQDQPVVAREVEAMLCWMDEETLQPRGKYLLKHTTRSVRALVTSLDYRVNVNTLAREDGIDRLGVNDIGKVQLKLQQPIVVDPYTANRATGAFILIDEHSNNTVAAGMIVAAS